MKNKATVYHFFLSTERTAEEEAYFARATEDINSGDAKVCMLPKGHEGPCDFSDWGQKNDPLNP